MLSPNIPEDDLNNQIQVDISPEEQRKALQKLPAQKIWLAVYTRPRWERKVNESLQAEGITTFCPLTKVLRQWKDRKKKVEEPLFKSYVFVHVDMKERALVRYVTGVVNFVYWLGKPAVIRPAEIETIKRFIGDYEDVQVEFTRMPIVPGTVVRVRQGLMMGHEAIARAAHNKLITVELESFGVRMIAHLPKESLEIIELPGIYK